MWEAANPLVDLADIVKIDLLASPPSEWRRIVDALGPRGIALLAEKVETERDFAAAAELGCRYFQGYFFSRPEVVSTRTIPGSKLNYLLLLRELYAPRADIEAVGRIVEREVALSFKLLRHINSAHFGLRNRITSLRQALLLLGLRGIRQWAAIALLADLGADRPSAVVTSSVLRAKLCESLAAESGLGGRAPDLFLMGLFSLLDALLGRPLSELLALVPMAEDCRAALLGEDNAARAIFEAAVAHERGDWPSMSRRARQLGVDERRLPALYLEAVRWSNSSIPMAA
jgi:EAL and modified HD-GYP domain-containing signal transduction protein